MTGRLLGEQGPEIAFGRNDARLLLATVQLMLDLHAVGDPRCSSRNISAYRRLANELRSHQDRCTAVMFVNEHAPLPNAPNRRTITTMSITEAAAALGYSQQHTRRIAESLGGTLLDGRWRIPTSAIDQHTQHRKEHTR